MGGIVKNFFLYLTKRKTDACVNKLYLLYCAGTQILTDQDENILTAALWHLELAFKYFKAQIFNIQQDFQFFNRLSEMSNK